MIGRAQPPPNWTVISPSDQGQSPV